MAIYNGDDGNNYYFGTADDDIINGGGGKDNLEGGAGNDTITGGTGNDYMNGGEGNDTYLIAKHDSADTIADFGGTDTIIFTDMLASDITLVSRSDDGRSLVLAYKGGKLTIDFELYAAKYGIETLKFSDGTVWGWADIQAKTLQTATNGDDKLYGYNESKDTFNGLGGNDMLWGYGGNDTLNGGAGNDYIDGGDNNDTLNGGSGNDIINGGNGNDTLNGGFGLDVLKGGDGNDWLGGFGAGGNVLSGGLGQDSFYFGSQSSNTITDFNVSDDSILVQGGGVFTDLFAGALAADQFKIIGNGGVVDDTDRIIYNTTTGGLSYDSDGSGAAAAVQIAILGKGLAMTAADFMVV